MIKNFEPEGFFTKPRTTLEKINLWRKIPFKQKKTPVCLLIQNIQLIKPNQICKVQKKSNNTEIIGYRALAPIFVESIVKLDSMKPD